MKLELIYSDREFQNWPTWPLIYEWEDVLARELELKIISSKRAYVVSHYADKILRFTSRKLFKDNRLIIFADKLIYKRPGLLFELLPRSAFYFTGSRNTVPVIIDFWKTIDLARFYQAYHNCRVVLIANLQAFNYLKASGCPLNIYHFPQSIADKYRLNAAKRFEKTYDLIIPGRADSVLLGFLRRFEHLHPGLEYLYREEIGGEFFYSSSKTGARHRGQDRAEYMRLLQASRICFYSTVGIDGDEVRTGGFSPVTPRLLEMVSAGCHIIARYPDNEETGFFEVDKICVSADTYEIFEQELSRALQGPGPDLATYENYLSKHYTSVRAELLKKILDETPG